MSYKYFENVFSNGQIVYAANMDETIQYKNGAERKFSFDDAIKLRCSIFDLREDIEYDPISKEEFERLKAQK